ncbi:hypothetical protein BaRGS_00010622 [Batillaria attramentaria]|uniref:Uncharacterized protein n=1 Tax=Batillaria attramentaria TaxID=370345 RepID=A0ABD0LEZ5_9CAEN
MSDHIDGMLQSLHLPPQSWCLGKIGPSVHWQQTHSVTTNSIIIAVPLVSSRLDRLTTVTRVSESGAMFSVSSGSAGPGSSTFTIGRIMTWPQEYGLLPARAPAPSPSAES